MCIEISNFTLECIIIRKLVLDIISCMHACYTQTNRDYNYIILAIGYAKTQETGKLAINACTGFMYN